MSSVSKKQLLVLLSVLILMAFLLSLDIKGLVKPTEDRKANNETKTAPALSLEQFLGKAKESLDPEQLGAIEEIENRSAEGRSAEELKYNELATNWDSAGNQVISALYLLKSADVSSNSQTRIKGAEKLKQASRMASDSTLSMALFTMAMDNYKEIYEADNKNLDAKIGLAVCYVERSENPMQGISMLLDVVKEFPDNIAANMNLGLFSMRSGQFEKATGRFETVAKKEPGAEVYFYLGEAYRNLGDKENALKAYKNARKYIKAPQLRAGIDHYINELNKAK